MTRRACVLVVLVMLADIRSARAGGGVERLRSWSRNDEHGERVHIQQHTGYVLAWSRDEALRECAPCAHIARTIAHPDGTREALDERGERVARYVIVDGRRDGPIQVWQAGVLVIDGAYLRGRPHGRWREWDRQGSLRLDATFVRGVLEGTSAAATFPTGSVRHGRWRAGREHGEWTITDKTGRVIEREHYRDGRRHGVQESFTADGRTRHRVVYVDGRREGVGEIHDGAGVTLQRWANNDLVAIEPTPASYRWNPGQLDLAIGPMFGRSDSIQTRVDLAFVLGRARSRNGVRAGGRYLALGPEVAVDAPFGPMATSPYSSFGAALELGWAWDAYAPSSQIPDGHVYARVAPYWTTTGMLGMRAGLGITAPAWTRRVYRTLDGRRDEQKPPSVEAKLVGNLLLGLFAPVWSLDHLEVAVELERGEGPRVGVLAGWGL